MVEIRPRAFITLLSVLLICLLAKLLHSRGSDTFVAVAVIGIHHVGEKIDVPRFDIDGHTFGPVGLGGGGTASECCILLHREWNPGDALKVEWDVCEYRNTGLSASENSNAYGSVCKHYLADVPLEKYSRVGNLFVHFFPEGKIRAVSSNFDVLSDRHPISPDDDHAYQRATSGLQQIGVKFTSGR